jgi:hypothetical protein
MTKIIAISGRLQSGKTTLSNYLHGHEMKRHDVIEKFFMSPEGKLVVNCTFHDENGKEFEEMGVLELDQQTDEFYQYASRRVWPLIRAYNFADSLKEMCVMLFNIPPECVYGTDEEKNTIQEHLRWENMPGVILPDWQTCIGDRHGYPLSKNDLLGFGITIHESGPMTAREFMQFLGTDIMRKIYEPIWVENCFKRIEGDSPEIAIIGDCRFINEIQAVQKIGGKVIRLTRSLYESTHQSEIDADSYEGFDGVIDNQNMSIEESCDSFKKILVGLGITQNTRETGKYTVSIK